jgi:GT2 family glycosyltransferase
MPSDFASVSVVIPTKDRRELLARFLPTYLKQPEVAEVIVVVDGSVDGTLEFLAQLAAEEPRVRVIDNGVNRGTPFTKNRGIEAAKGELIFIGEDDLEVTDGFFGKLIEHKRALGVDVICGRNVWRYDGEAAGQALDRSARIKGSYVNHRTIEINTGMPLPQDSQQKLLAAPMLADAHVFRKVGFDERYKVNFWREETDFQVSAQELGYKLGTCTHAVCFNYMTPNDRSGSHAAAGWRRTRWVIINNWRFIRKHEAFISAHFDIGSPYSYITRFAVRRFVTELVVPMLVRTKRGLRARRFAST